MLLKLLAKIHDFFIFDRRKNKLTRLVASVWPKDVKKALDIGCGDGWIGYLLSKKLRSIEILGLETLPRGDCKIECLKYDGKKIPLRSNSVDLSFFIDVMHHENNLDSFIEESKRITRRYFIIKDHFCENKIDLFILKIMDWFGNRAHGVSLVYNYKSKKEWDRLYKKHKLRVLLIKENINLYPGFFNLIFGRNLHFVALLQVNK